jgi:hypothetical protein
MRSLSLPQKVFTSFSNILLHTSTRRHSQSESCMLLWPSSHQKLYTLSTCREKHPASRIQHRTIYDQSFSSVPKSKSALRYGPALLSGIGTKIRRTSIYVDALRIIFNVYKSCCSASKLSISHFLYLSSSF